MNKKQIVAESPIQAESRGAIARKLFQMLLAGGLAALCVLPAQAAVAIGDQFTSTFTETSGSDPGSTGTATLTVGTPASPGFFNISSFSVIVNPDLCFSCGLLTEDLSGVLYDAATSDLKGHITGTFNGSGGNLHRFDLALTDPAGTWTFTNVRVFDGRTEISSGTYSPAVSAVPEPSAWAMLILGLLTLIYGATYRATTERRASIVFAAINRG